MISNLNRDRVPTLARLAKDNMGRVLLDELREQHARLVGQLHDAQDDVALRQTQGACRALRKLISELEDAPEDARSLY